MENWHRAASGLRDIRPAFERVGGPVAQSLAQEIDQKLRRGLDLDYFADLASQPQELYDLAKRCAEDRVIYGLILWCICPEIVKDFRRY